MEVKIIGAGPCGSAAAISALKHNHKVTVYEEHLKAGYPQHCSGLVSKKGLDFLIDLINYKKHIINKIDGAVIDFAGEKIEINKTAYVINRTEFDNTLTQISEEQGAKIIYGKRFVYKNRIDAEAIIGADGVFSSTARFFNFPKITKFAHTIKTTAYFPVPEPNKVFVFYNNNFFPGFFGWVIPHNEERAEIGAGTTNPTYLKKGFDFLLKKIQPNSFERYSGRIIPLVPRKKLWTKYGKTHILLVGDAAGHVKSSSGGGVVFGINGAMLAGSLIHSPEKYSEIWKKENERDILTHILIREFFSFQPNLGFNLLAAVSKYSGLDKLISLYGDMDKPTNFFPNLINQFSYSLLKVYCPNLIFRFCEQ